jgi:hypothetical protein
MLRCEVWWVDFDHKSEVCCRSIAGTLASAGGTKRRSCQLLHIQENGIIFDNIESGSILPSSGSLCLADSRAEIRQCDPLSHLFYARVIFTRSR